MVTLFRTFLAILVQAQFRLPLEMIWSRGNNVLWTIRQMVYGEKMLMGEFCGQVLRPSLVEELLDQRFDVAVVDLMFNECGLALAHQLGVPSVGYWAFSFASGVQVTNKGVYRFGGFDSILLGVYHHGGSTFACASYDVKAEH